MGAGMTWRGWRVRVAGQINAESLARPIGRNQTKARIAPVSLGVGIGLDQPTVRGAANNAKKRASMARASDLRRCRCNLRLRFLRFPFLASMRYPTRHDPCGKRFRRNSALRAVHRKITAGCGDLPGWQCRAAQSTRRRKEGRASRGDQRHHGIAATAAGHIPILSARSVGPLRCQRYVSPQAATEFRWTSDKPTPACVPPWATKWKRKFTRIRRDNANAGGTGSGFGPQTGGRTSVPSAFIPSYPCASAFTLPGS